LEDMGVLDLKLCWGYEVNLTPDRVQLRAVVNTVIIHSSHTVFETGQRACDGYSQRALFVVKLQNIVKPLLR
jgi:hypothetical protein